MPKNSGRSLSSTLSNAAQLAGHALLMGVLLLPVGLGRASEIPAEDTIDWAKEQQFWSFCIPKPQRAPAVRNARWPRQPLDYFILARLEQKGLSPSPEVDRRTLIRRVTLDLTGLPPTPEEVEAFLKDRRRDAYERLLDRLFASTRFGEHMASLWLPLARYAEDQAHQVGDDTKFFYPNAYKYREWVINAFNCGLPYDQFVKLQLAADRIEGTNSVNLAALGFLGLGPKYYNRGRIDVMADEWEDRVDTLSRTVLGLTVACARCHDHKFDPITMSDYYALAGVFASTKMVNKKADGSEEKAEKAEKMDPNSVHVVEDGEAKNLNVFLRGSVDRKGPVVERQFVRVLSREPVPFKDGSGRKELAECVANRNNPLTARVMVNRLWGAFFGRPLVITPSNFGHSGQPPSHPELLDDLAIRFMDNGWSIKGLAREMALSSTYRQSARLEARKASIDANNELFWRMNRRRLSVEQWRDSVLFVSGQLDLTGGKSLELDDPANHRRTVYARVSRLKLNDMLTQFDYPDANVHAEKRAVTTTATQKLFMLNSPFMLSQAKALSWRVISETPESDQARVVRAHRLLFGRDPQKVELALALAFLGKPTASEMAPWEQYAQILLASNEMIYVD
ncbi:MAG: DUF1549 and DUF1553 domain-containing protein [Verrucomicrobiales bacterium]|nr:DUF1549 and DUF1553 domain-containing protein [Verrucomicrobiales bacterium]